MRINAGACVLMVGFALGACGGAGSDAVSDAVDQDVADTSGETHDVDVDEIADSSPPDDGDAPGDAPGAVASPIDRAGLCNVPANPSSELQPGTELLKLTLSSDPRAVCNDGSPAVLYVSPAPAGSADADKWLIWLQGGGSCNDTAGCGDRWCSRGAHTNSPTKMSSRWTPDGIRGGGIFSRSPAPPAVNRFADYNMVVAFYCTSDNWIGDKQHDRLDDASGVYPPFSLEFRGARVVDAMIAALKAGASSDDGAVALPPLDEASQVLFMGTSAGGGGARLNADRIAETLRATNPSVDVRLVVDAGFHPKEHPEIDEGKQEDFLDTAHDVLTDFYGATLDASCLAHHADDPRPCAELVHLLLHHIDTPWFVKMDLSDAVNAPGLFDDAPSFARGVLALVTSLADLPSFREEGGDYVPGVFAPSCGHHVNLNVGDFYRIRVTPGAPNPGLSHHDVLWNWARDASPTAAIHDPDAGTQSICP